MTTNDNLRLAYTTGTQQQSKQEYEIVYGTSIKLKEINSKKEIKFTSQIALAQFCMLNKIGAKVKNLGTSLSKPLQGIALNY